MTDVPINEYGCKYTISVDPDEHIGKRIIEGGMPYEMPLLEDIYLKTRGVELVGTTAIDAGAHIGNHSLWMAVVCGLRVRAYEPSISAFKLLSQNAQGKSIECNAKALGDMKGMARPVGDGVWKYTADHKAAQTAVVRLDDAVPIDERVSVIKADVEGFEAKIIKGAKDLIERCEPTIYTEARDTDAFYTVKAQMDTLGYRATRKFSDKRVATPVFRWERCRS